MREGVRGGEGGWRGGWEDKEVFKEGRTDRSCVMRHFVCCWFSNLIIDAHMPSRDDLYVQDTVNSTRTVIIAL